MNLKGCRAGMQHADIHRSSGRCSGKPWFEYLEARVLMSAAVTDTSTSPAATQSGPEITKTNSKSNVTTTLATSANPSVLGQNVTFTATVKPAGNSHATPTGSVTFMDGTVTLGTAALASGVAKFTLATLAVGSHPITAVYGGSPNLGPSTSAAVSQIVTAAGTNTTLTSSITSPVYGQAVTFTAAVTVRSPGATTPSATVSFWDGSTNLGTSTLDSTGHATFTISSLKAGSHSITAAYAGDKNTLSSASPTLALSVTSGSTTVGLIESTTNSLIGQPVTFTATVQAVSPAAGTPTGTITFMDGTAAMGTGTLNASGQATFTTTSLSAGTHAIKAVYGSDANFLASTSTVVNQLVVKPLLNSTVYNGEPASMTLASGQSFVKTITNGYYWERHVQLDANGNILGDTFVGTPCEDGCRYTVHFALARGAQYLVLDLEGADATLANMTQVLTWIRSEIANMGATLKVSFFTVDGGDNFNAAYPDRFVGGMGADHPLKPEWVAFINSLDFVCPCFYAFQDLTQASAMQAWISKAQVVITMTRAVTAKPIMPFTSPRYWDTDASVPSGSFIPQQPFTTMVNTLLSLADGLVVWDPGCTLQGPEIPTDWDASAAWWLALYQAG